MRGCCFLFLGTHVDGNCGFQAADLKKYCLDFIFKNFETVTRTKAFDALSAEPTLLLEVTRESISRSSRR